MALVLVSCAVKIEIYDLLENLIILLKSSSYLPNFQSLTYIIHTESNSLSFMTLFNDTKIKLHFSAENKWCFDTCVVIAAFIKLYSFCNSAIHPSVFFKQRQL